MVMEYVLSSQNSISMNAEPIINDQHFQGSLPYQPVSNLCPIRGPPGMHGRLTGRSNSRVFGYHYQKQRYKSSKQNFLVIFVLIFPWLLFKVVQFVWKCIGARDSVIALLRKANFQAASHCCLYKFSPQHTLVKTIFRPH